MVQQRPIISRSEIENEIEEILTKGIPGNSDGPDSRLLRKASGDVQQIMSLIDRYANRI